MDTIVEGYDQNEDYVEGEKDQVIDWNAVIHLQDRMDDITERCNTEEERDYFGKALLVEMYEVT